LGYYFELSILNELGYYQGPPVMAPPQYQYAPPAPPPPPQRREQGFLEGWYVSFSILYTNPD